MSMTETQPFVRKEFTPQKSAPVSEHGVVGWAMKNLFSSPFNIALTLFGVFLIYILLKPLIMFGLVNAVWTGNDRTECAVEHAGACWAMVKAKFSQYIYFQYPFDERWRVDLTMWGGLALLVPLLIPSLPLKKLNAILLLVVFPVASLILLTGGNAAIGGFIGFGDLIVSGSSLGAFAIDWVLLTAVIGGIVFLALKLADADGFGLLNSILVLLIGLGVILFVCGMDFGLVPVETPLWGGLLVTLVIAVVGIVASLPIGIALALGRRSDMPLIRSVSIAFIEFWRGIPLITVLFMSSVMLPLFLPEGVTFDKLLRALIGVALFSSAYMAETIRGGLQAIPKGQYEGAQALGLSYWKMMNLIVLPQAIKHVIPGIVNSFIALFKDTTLVLIIGMFDLLGAIQTSFTDPKWASENQSHTGYLFAALIFWVFCFAMSRYSIFMENKLHTGHKR